jgi:hypothetical protein
MLKGQAQPAAEAQRMLVKHFEGAGWISVLVNHRQRDASSSFLYPRRMDTLLRRVSSCGLFCD